MGTEALTASRCDDRDRKRFWARAGELGITNGSPELSRLLGIERVGVGAMREEWLDRGHTWIEANLLLDAYPPHEEGRPFMAGLNKVQLIGNVGADPEMKYTANGNAVTTFRMAVNRSYSGQDGERREETEWFSIVTWNKLAETCSQFLTKGRECYVEGRLQTRSWEGQDGVKRYKTEVIAYSVLFLGQRAGGGDPGPAAEPVGVPAEADRTPVGEVE